MYDLQYGTFSLGIFDEVVPNTKLEETPWRGETCMYNHFGGGQKPYLVNNLSSLIILRGSKTMQNFSFVGHCPRTPSWYQPALYTEEA